MVGRWSMVGRRDGRRDGRIGRTVGMRSAAMYNTAKRTNEGRKKAGKGRKEGNAKNRRERVRSVFGARVEVECWRRGVCGVFGGKSSSSSSSSSSSGGFGAVAAECVVVFPEESACCVDEEVRARVGGGRCRCRSTQKRTKRRKLCAAQATQNLLSSFSSRRDFSRTGRSSAAGMGDGRDWWPFPA